jgi:hypothetical protein
MGWEQIATLPYADRARAALAHLFEAHQLAVDVGHDAGDFAVPIDEFQGIGVRWAVLKWLVLTGYASVDARSGGSMRRLIRGGANILTDKSSLLLTEAGVELARQLGRTASERSSGFDALPYLIGAGARTVRTPHWNAILRKLYLGDALVRQYPVAAPNQESVLTAFQEEGWPPRIDDPLPPREELDPKIRLRDTITCLNRGQKPCRIRFHGDGAGRGVLWELIA